MQQELHFKGTQFNQINTIFYAGYCLGQIPNNLIMQRVSPRIWLPATCFAWGLLTLGTGFTHHPWQIMVIRFFQGMVEASCFVGTHWILGSWYKEEELGKRTAIFTASGLAGSMFSGFLQGGIYKNLNGKAGLSGWRWLYIIDFLITVPIAIYGYLCFPDTPETTHARYLSQEERRLAVERLPQVEKQRGVVGWSLIRRVVLTWHWWMFCLLWIISSNTEMYSSNAIMNLWLKSLNEYTIEQINYLPTTVSAAGIVATLIMGWTSDYTRLRYPPGIVLSITAIISGAVMLSPPTRGTKFFALILNGAQYAGQAVFFAWANDLCRHDDAKRSVVVASMNMFSTAVYLWWSLIFYNVTQGPDWFEGSIVMIVMGGCLALCTVAIVILQRRQEKRERSERQMSSAHIISGEDDIGKVSLAM